MTHNIVSVPEVEKFLKCVFTLKANEEIDYFYLRQIFTQNEDINLTDFFSDLTFEPDRNNISELNS